MKLSFPFVFLVPALLLSGCGKRLTGAYRLEAAPEIPRRALESMSPDERRQIERIQRSQNSGLSFEFEGDRVKVVRAGSGPSETVPYRLSKDVLYVDPVAGVSGEQMVFLLRSDGTFSGALGSFRKLN